MQGMVGLYDINRYFSFALHLDHQIKYRAVNYLTSLNSPNLDPFKFSPVVKSDIKKIILSINLTLLVVITSADA